MRRRLVWIQGQVSVVTYQLQLFVSLTEAGFPAVSNCTAQGEVVITVRSFDVADAQNYIEFTTAQTIIRNEFASIEAIVQTNQNALGQIFDLQKPSIEIEYAGWIQSLSLGGTLVNAVLANSRIRVRKFVDGNPAGGLDDQAEVYISGFPINDPIGTRRDFSGTWTG
jgi:hypothetical protein